MLLNTIIHTPGKFWFSLNFNYFFLPELTFEQTVACSKLFIPFSIVNRKVFIGCYSNQILLIIADELFVYSTMELYFFICHLQFLPHLVWSLQHLTFPGGLPKRGRPRNSWPIHDDDDDESGPGTHCCYPLHQGHTGKSS